MVAAGVACSHSEPFASRPYTTDGPFSGAIPHRITFNPGDDRTPTWLPDGSGILYSSEREDRRDHDRCIAQLPPDGGTVVRYLCETDPIQDDSTNVYESASVAPDGRMLFFETTGWIGQHKGPEGGIMLSTVNDPQQATRLRRVPYPGPSGRQHSSLRLIRWLSPKTAVYLGERLFYEGSTFLPDTFITGQEVVRLDLGGAAPGFAMVPGTDYASSVALSGEPGVIYYTLGGDSKVYRQELSSGSVTVVHDFGLAGIARDVQVNVNVLVAVVGGSVLFRNESANGWVQRDEGGELHIMDRASGSETVFTGREPAFAPDSVLFRHPELSPDGAHLVVEVTPWAPVHAFPQSGFTALNHRADLWIFEP